MPVTELFAVEERKMIRKPLGVIYEGFKGRSGLCSEQ